MNNPYYTPRNYTAMRDSEIVSWFFLLFSLTQNALIFQHNELDKRQWEIQAICSEVSQNRSNLIWIVHLMESLK